MKLGTVMQNNPAMRKDAIISLNIGELEQGDGYDTYLEYHGIDDFEAHADPTDLCREVERIDINEHGMRVYITLEGNVWSL